MNGKIPQPLTSNLAQKLSGEIAKLVPMAMAHEWNADLETTGFQDIATAVRGGPVPSEGRFKEFLRFLHQRSVREHDPQVENRAAVVRQTFDSLTALLDARGTGIGEEILRRYDEARRQVQKARGEIDRAHLKNRYQLLQAAMTLATADQFIEAGKALEQITKGGRGAA